MKIWYWIIVWLTIYFDHILVFFYNFILLSLYFVEFLFGILKSKLNFTTGLFLRQGLKTVSFSKKLLFYEEHPEFNKWDFFNF